jgi:hypothetical protein
MTKSPVFVHNVVEKVRSMLTIDSVCVYSSPVRERALVVADELRRAGIAPAFLPSAQAISTWDIEVAADAVADARAIADGLAVH